jgi:hypothetical protein
MSEQIAPLAPVEHDRLLALAALREYPFRSELRIIGPVIAWLRERANKLAGYWYAQPLLAQQRELNVRLVEQITLQQHVLAQEASQRAAEQEQRAALLVRSELIEAQLREAQVLISTLDRDLVHATKLIGELRLALNVRTGGREQ